MGALFFRQGNAQCKVHCRTRDSAEDHHVRGLAFIELLWLEGAPFVDANALHHATQDMPPVVWELYLVHALRRCGIAVVRQHRTKKGQRGPDLRTEHPDVWIEAVTPTPGTGPDALQAPVLGEVNSVPIEPFVLRLRTVIEAKAKIIAGYLKDGIISHGQATIIAISGMRLHTQHNEQHIPRIVRAALGVGDLVVAIGRQTREQQGYSLEHHDEITNAKGAPIRTDVFLDPAYAHVSALLYSAADWINLPDKPGTEFVLIHNPGATTPLPPGWLGVGDEYSWENGAIRRQRHTTNN